MLEITPTWEPALEGLARELRAEGTAGRWQVRGLKSGARALFFAALFRRCPRPALIVVPSGREAERFADELRFFLGEAEATPTLERRVHYFPSWEVPPFEDVSPTADTIAARIEGLYHLRQATHPILVTTPEALLLRVPPREEFARRYLYLVEGDDIDRERLAEQLDGWGYRRLPLVEDRGEFSLRGGIVDIYPPAHPQPLRLELVGDTIDAIHEFDPVTQRRLRRLPELILLPVRELDLPADRRKQILRTVEERTFELDVERGERNVLLEGLESGLTVPGVELCLPYCYAALDSLASYLPDDIVVCIDAAGEVDAALERTWTDVERRAAERAAERRFFPPAERLYLPLAEWRREIERYPTIETESLDVLAAPDDANHLSVRSFSTTDVRVNRVHPRQEPSFGPVAERVRAWLAEGQRVFCVAGDEAQVNRLSRLLEANDIAVDNPARPFPELLEDPAARVRVLIGKLSEGFRLPDQRLVVLTDADVFGETRRRAARRVSVAQLLKNLNELKAGDYVVHLDHGVGIYRGLRHMQVAGTEGDYLHLEYADGDRLYLPVERIALVQRYVGSDGTPPALDKLGGSSWERVKRKTRESILAMARELLEIYAAREIFERPPVRETDGYYREFEAAFPFEETPDQKQAIDDVVADLRRDKPMDRLICGDVGYGKTEVALRAAFLAVMEGRQVAVLVPTTVLAQQHSNTFRRRFEGYPVRVEMLSRFRTAAESKQTLRDIADGKVDIVIGTHRLLQSDVEFKRLGLLVIDEEHRFGVRHKERIKQMRQLVDVIALTATPIPRTLQMSLLGIRDLSVIETPPVDRLAIRTYVTRYDEDLIRDSILRELRRKGQVFFVHNRVQNIDAMARHLQTLVPEARIVVGHGQMAERELEKVMLQFMNRDADVLVSSAIIESGLDIPNANTILINRADHFGLAQLYQLRGRVGRSHERAYAYLMIPGEHLITRDAQKRLRVLQELDELGGGFRLAAHDLEIRGAGNLLGKQQSGQVAAVGFELYTQMLEDAVHELRGKQRRIDVEPEIQLGFPAFVPESYIPDEDQRLAFYRRLAAAETMAEQEEIALEMRERYGPIPPLVDSFLRVMDLRRRLKALLVLRAALRGGWVTLQFHPEAPVDVDRLVAMVEKGKGRFKLSADFQLSFRPRSSDWDGVVDDLQSVLDELRAASRSISDETVLPEEASANAVP